MTADELRALQAPLKALYREQPAAALKTLHATGKVQAGTLSCNLTTEFGQLSAGLHPAAGGDGSWACSADLLLQSLVACAGVTLAAVAKAMGLELRDSVVTAEGDLDFRGTLGVNKEVPVGFTEIRVRFDLDLDASEEQVRKLIELTERYCVIYRTLAQPPKLATSVKLASKLD